MSQKLPFPSRLRHVITTNAGSFSLGIAVWVPFAGFAAVRTLI